MRIHQAGKANKLYRRVNTTTRHRSNNPGADYREQRNKKSATYENLPQRESMKGKQYRGVDYSPLFHFLLSKIGQPWDDVYSEAKSRLDKTAPLFLMVALHEHERSDYVCCGDFSFYPGLYVDESGVLRQVNPNVSPDDIPVSCRCCTHTFIGVPLTWKG